VRNIVRYISFQGDNGEVRMNDVRFALRQHFKHSGFFVAAVLMLAVGIGATTSLFSAVYGVLIDPYPYAKPGEIWTPAFAAPQQTRGCVRIRRRNIWKWQSCQPSQM